MFGDDEREWAAFFLRYRAVAVRFVGGLVGGRHDAEDLFQEAARAVYERGRVRGTFGSAEHARNYLFRTLRNLAVDHGRMRARHMPADLDAVPELPSLVPGPIDALLAVEAKLERDRRERSLARAVEALDPARREVVRLRFGVGLTLAEIAVRTGAPLSTVHSRVESALARMRERIGNFDAPT